jgi:cytochrome c553
MEKGIRSPWRRLAFVIVSCGFAAAASAQDVKEVLRKTPDAAHGAELFRNCVACHGTDGFGAPDGTVPTIAGQHASVIAKQLIDYRQARRWDIRMERIADKHLLRGAQDIADVAAYASSLTHGGPLSTGEGTWIAEGEKTYAQRCAGCHGAAGEGDAKKRIPRLAGQHFDYLRRQMYDGVDGRRPNLSASHVHLFKAFVMEDFEGVADYLSRLH